MQPGDRPPAADGHQVATAADELAVERDVELRANFCAFFDHQFPLVVRFVMRCGASLHGAQDAAQEAFVAAWRDLKRGRWEEVANQEGWIRMVALRQHWHAQGRCRKVRVISVPDFPDLERPGLSTVDMTIESLDVMKVLSALDPELQAVMACDMDGFTATETGQALGLTEQQVRDRRKKARRKLARQLGVRKKQKGEQA
jgi:RNA polymerase sigma factor (sigma-70 family)